MPNGISSQCSSIQQDADAMVITKVVAKPMLTAVSVFLEMPMNGHNPRNFTSTTLFTSTVLSSSKRYSLISIISCACNCKRRATRCPENRAAQNQALGAYVHQTSAKNICRCRVVACTDVANTTSGARLV